MNLFLNIRKHIISCVDKLALTEAIPQGLALDNIAVEPPRDAAHGDVATNVAMVLARPAAIAPRELAEKLGRLLEEFEEVERADIAGPGFINIHLRLPFWHQCLSDILDLKNRFGESTIGKGKKVNIEYVSANPTGPLHIGHARGAVFGDVLASLLSKVGYDVTREYYINDAGAQVDALARSAFMRYREVLGDEIGHIEDGLYPGAYLKPVGQILAKKYKEKFKNSPESEWLGPVRKIAIDEMMKLIRADLAELGVKPDVFTSERTLVDSGKVIDCLNDLGARGLIYEGVLDPPKGKKLDDWEPRPQTLFKAVELGDDVDRALKKSDGTWTYFAGDIAYHRDKFQRGFSNQIDVWGADHGGYIKRVKSAVKAVTDNEATLDVKICQLVKLLDNGKPIKMSKRSGNFVTLRALVDEVGKDIVRFIMLTRKNDAPLDFDLSAVTAQSRDNPVWYVQYAHARCNSLSRMIASQMPRLDISYRSLKTSKFELLKEKSEIDLIKLMAGWPRLIEASATAKEPHRIAFYLNDLASAFHSLWTQGKESPSLRFMIEDDPELTKARVALVCALQMVIASGLELLGIKPLEEMR
ncbi:MAG: arginine--tRNA ligase [Pseudomonadota bacterium]|nr:arginine--tRNA ligase [Pseudomonadota bacterium]